MDTTATYKNGQIVFRQEGDILTNFFITGEIKATGKYKDGQMEGKWIFNKKAGYLRQIGNFLHNQKHGEWIRYSENGTIEYHAEFLNGKLVKKTK